jgi:Uma2 family endonuclease
MATDTVAQDIPPVEPLALPPCVDNLVTEDNTPVDNIFSEKQQRLLTEPLFSSWTREGTRRNFVALANVGLFYSVRQPPLVPDVLLSLDVDLPADVHPQPHRSYFLWEYGKPPDVVIEIVSNRQGGECTERLTGYARIGVTYYVIYDPDRLLSERPLRAFELQAGVYRELAEPIWLPGVELGLQIWHGRFEDLDNTWLRWVEKQGHPLATGAERAEREQARAERERARAEREQTRAESERDRADRERQRADRLAVQLRRLGAEPEA